VLTISSEVSRSRKVVDITDSNAHNSDAENRRSLAHSTRQWTIKTLAKIHVRVNLLSGGRLANKVQGHDVCFVTMTGAVSGRTLIKPLIYIPYQNGVLLVASIGGAPKNPAWHGNLVKHPDIQVRHRGRTVKLTSRLATATEKPALWMICDAAFPPYAEYRARTNRDIPIFVCEPRVGSSNGS
jgi:deazaflavin-dependent oxidoreductase (nitroreductase family)